MFLKGLIYKVAFGSIELTDNITGVSVSFSEGNRVRIVSVNDEFVELKKYDNDSIYKFKNDATLAQLFQWTIL